MTEAGHAFFGARDVFSVPGAFLTNCEFLANRGKIANSLLHLAPFCAKIATSVSTHTKRVLTTKYVFENDKI